MTLNMQSSSAANIPAFSWCVKNCLSEKKIRQTKVIQNQTKLKIKQLKLNSNKINQCEHQHKQEEKEAREESN